MRLLKAAQVPIIEEVQNEKWAIPVMTLRDFVEWAAEFDEAYLDKATKGMSPQERFQHVVFIGLMPTNMKTMRRMVSSPEGIKRVLETCLPKAKIVARRKSDEAEWERVDREEVSEEAWKEVIEYGDPDELEVLANRLGDHEDPQPPVVATNAAGGTDSKESDPTSKSKKTTP